MIEETELTPRHRFGSNMTWGDEEDGIRIGIETYVVSEQRLEFDPYRDRSPSYAVTGVIIQKNIGNL